MNNTNTKRGNVDATEITDLAVIAALDAMEANHPDAYKLLVGVPATYSIGSDRYVTKIIAATPSLHTITIEGGQVFRWNKKHGRYMAGKSNRLTIGYAEDYRDPSF